MRKNFPLLALFLLTSAFVFVQTGVAQTSSAQTSVAQISIAPTSVAQTSSAQTSSPRVSSAQVSLTPVNLAQKPVPFKIDNAFVQQAFGDQFTMVADVAPVFGDLDGDGIEDVVIGARCKNPMLDQAEHNYHVIDPYYEYFGYGDPRITTTFSEGDPARRGLVALIIHGEGPEAWRSAKPKAKYVVVNLPYKGLSVRKMEIGRKKRTIEALFVQEAGESGQSSAVFFDVKKLKYRYMPMGGEMQ